ncbi:amidase family protein [Variovorax sp. J22R133]|uniref:amidase family protein n=1 Tax=Variovorax brevis TaxID=3053503 RepID=UPI0025779E6A|nr:amidase family protein [Variovorax sp. J22R133]MDM0110673.1 amidase family protein [Variovorax sp. J22R133]
MDSTSTQSAELWRLPAARVAELVRARDISAVEAASAALARLAAVNPRINAVVDHRPEEVLARARDIDAALARGNDPGPLAGVPVTVKINVDQRGFATSNGVRLQKDAIAQSNSPVVDNLLKAGAVIVGRTNTPAFSYRWFTNNGLHGRTLNPRDAALTPGGSSGGAASAVASGIGHIGHGTDIAGSIRYPAFACGIHGLRPSLGRVAAFNASAPERAIGGQIMAVSGPLARTVGDLRLALQAMSAPDARDPWWVPAPLTGPAAPRSVALCLRPDGLQTQEDVIAALLDAADRLRDAGWTVEEVDALPPIREALGVQIALWMGDSYDALVASAEREGDAGAIAALAGQAQIGHSMTLEKLSAALTRRATITRQWQLFLERYPVVLLPACAELPFANDLDLQGPEGYARVWEAQMTMIGLPVTGLPSLVVSTRMSGSATVGVQLLAGRFREDLCLAAGEAIEARGVPPSPVDPR